MTSWRDSIKVHPAADLLPPLEPEALAELADDIKANGMLVPVVTWQDKDGAIWLIDGRHRLDALESIGDPCTDEAGGLSIATDPRRWDTDDPTALVVGLNIRRRHLSAAQKRELVAKLIVVDPQRSNRQIAAMIDVSHSTVASVRDHLEATGGVAKLATSRDTLGRRQPARHRPTSTPKPGGAKQVSIPSASRHSKVDEIVHDLHRLAANGLDVRPRDVLAAADTQGKRSSLICSARLVRDWLDLLREAGSP